MIPSRAELYEAILSDKKELEKLNKAKQDEQLHEYAAILNREYEAILSDKKELEKLNKAKQEDFYILDMNDELITNEVFHSIEDIKIYLVNKHNDYDNEDSYNTVRVLKSVLILKQKIDYIVK
jgi:hypothetical protein